MGNWKDVDFKGKTSGQIKVKCPTCIGNRSNKNDTSLSVNLGLGVGKCHYCGDVFIEEGEKEQDEHKVVNYKIPKQDWMNYTNLSDNTVKWFNQRGLSQITIDDFKIGEKVVFFPGSKRKDKNMNAIVFNYFQDKTLVHEHYRSGDKDFAQLADGRKTLYNIDSIKNQPYAIITEGQVDCMSWHEVGLDSVVSVPSGVNSFGVVEQMMSVFDGMKIYLGTDKDLVGIEMEKRIVKLFGKSRCYRMEYPEDCKDPNDVLVKHGKQAMLDVFESAKNVALIGDVIDSSENMDYYLEQYYGGNIRKGVPLGLGVKFDNEFVLRNNAYHIIIAKTNIGKSVIGYWMLYKYTINTGDKVIMFSSENTSAIIKHTLIGYYLNDNPTFVYQRNKPLWDEASAYVDKHFIFMNTQTEAGLKEILDIAEAIHEDTGASMIFIDPINSVPMIKHVEGMTDYGYHSWAAAYMMRFSHRVMSILMGAHTITGAGRNELPPKLYDIEFGGVYVNKADASFIFHRNKGAADETERNTTKIWVAKLRDKQIYGGNTTPDDDPNLLRFTGFDFVPILNNNINGEVDARTVTYNK